MVTAEEQGKALVHRLYQTMGEEIRQGKSQGNWSQSMLGWNYPPPLLFSRGMFMPMRFELQENTFERRRFTLHTPISAKRLAKDRDLIEKYREKHDRFLADFVQWLDEIPQMVDRDKALVRWPVELKFSYSENGQRVEIELVAQRLRDNYLYSLVTADAR